VTINDNNLLIKNLFFFPFSRNNNKFRLLEKFYIILLFSFASSARRIINDIVVLSTYITNWPKYHILLPIVFSFFDFFDFFFSYTSYKSCRCGTIFLYSPSAFSASASLLDLFFCRAARSEWTAICMLVYIFVCILCKPTHSSGIEA
jgi:hypothetical protein